MALPLFTATGNLTADPELRFTSAGAAVCTFNLACSERKKNEDGTWEDSAVTFIKVTTWRQLAENVAESVVKGSTVSVVGKLRSKNHEAPDGVRKTYFEVDAFDVAVSLTRAPAQSIKSSKPTIDVDPWAAPVQSTEIPF